MLSSRYEKNLQGDIVAVYDNAGTKLMSYEYDAFGNCIRTTHVYREPAYNNPFRYRGYYYDQDLELYYLNSRYYDCFIGRFINADNFDTVCATPNALTDKNLFAYCDNNPVMRRDAGGEFWHIVIGAAAGALVGGIVKIISNKISGEALTNELVTAMLAGAASGTLASTGVGIVGMIAGNAAISMTENSANQIIENGGFTNFNVGDMLIDGAIGAIAGALGGARKGSKHLTSLGKQTSQYSRMFGR